MTPIKEASENVDDKAMAKIVFGAFCKPTSYRTIQDMARRGDFGDMAYQLGRRWMFYPGADRIIGKYQRRRK